MSLTKNNELVSAVEWLEENSIDDVQKALKNILKFKNDVVCFGVWMIGAYKGYLRPLDIESFFNLRLHEVPCHPFFNSLSNYNRTKQSFIECFFKFFDEYEKFSKLNENKDKIPYNYIDPGRFRIILDSYFKTKNNFNCRLS